MSLKRPRDKSESYHESPAKLHKRNLIRPTCMSPVSDDSWINVVLLTDTYFMDRCVVCHDEFPKAEKEAWQKAITRVLAVFPEEMIELLLLYTPYIPRIRYHCTRECRRQDIYPSGTPVNRCMDCGTDMGECNPRQLCGKWRCLISSF
jgi:hypothetical protein